MKRIVMFLLAALFANLQFAKVQEPSTPWKFKLTSEQGGIKIFLDLYEETIEVPGMDMFGPMNGYLGGNIYGVWMVTSFDIKSDKEAHIRMSNDFGSDTQDMNLTFLNDSTLRVDLKGGVSIKKVVDKKLSKIPSTIIFKTK